MTDPEYRTGVLWGVLALLLLFGTVASAFLVWAVTDWWALHRTALDAVTFGVAGAIAAFAFLLLAGILYRVDRLRGVPHRRVALFE
jgi:hypothetical protein